MGRGLTGLGPGRKAAHPEYEFTVIRMTVNSSKAITGSHENCRRNRRHGSQNPHDNDGEMKDPFVLLN